MNYQASSATALSLLQEGEGLGPCDVGLLGAAPPSCKPSRCCVRSAAGTAPGATCLSAGSAAVTRDRSVFRAQAAAALSGPAEAELTSRHIRQD